VSVVKCNDVTTGTEGLLSSSTHEHNSGGGGGILVPLFQLTSHKVAHVGVDSVECLGLVEDELKD